MNRLRLLFGGVVFLASFLLFLMEPIAARQLLPILGGSAAVWITCLVFFQTALLLGYLCAHWMARRRSRHAYLLLLALAGITVLAELRSRLLVDGAAHPILTVFGALSISIGVPFLVLSATSPLLQVWWARVESGEIPYRLYAVSNVGSLLALALYPTVIEPHSTLHAQRFAWGCGFGVFALLSAWLALKTRPAREAVMEAPGEAELAAPRATLRDKVLWVVLPMGAAMQLSAVTSYLTSNVAPIPLLWILPLSVYLLTIIVAFQFRVRLPWAILARVMVLMLAALAYSLTKANGGWPLWLSLLFFLVELFFACFFCHSAATKLRPARASEVTLFYLLFAAGGALGAFLVGIAAPLLFSVNLDLPITFLVIALLALAVNWNTSWNQRLLWGVASAAMVVLVFLVRHAYEHHTIVAERNFYASLRVTDEATSDAGVRVRTLMNGSIRHGAQILGTESLRRTPTTYYTSDSGVGLAVRFCCQERARNIGVIGLGAGTLAAYGKAGDRIRFYEINPEVAKIARDTFTFIGDSAAKVEIVEGDARTSLTGEAPQNFDVLVVDAFSGDAIPIHLLTTEAMALYGRHLKPNGILAFHISNRHVDLAPAIELLAASAGMQARRFWTGSTGQPGEYSSTWMLLTASPDFFAQPQVSAVAHAPESIPGLKVWTDDYSALMPLIRW